MKDKKGSELLYSAVIFIILNIVFFAALLIFVSRAETGVDVTEQNYAKEIALLIDQMEPGTKIVMDVSKIYDLADKNKINRLNTIVINNTENNIYVQAAEGKGYNYNFFTGYDIIWNLGLKSGKLELEAVKK